MENYRKSFGWCARAMMCNISRACGERPHTFARISAVIFVSKQFVQYLKGSSSLKLQMEYMELNKQYWGWHLWARGYFVASSGNVTDEIIAE